jgi:hypothetical protein
MRVSAIITSARACSASSPPLLLSPFVLAELDYLVMRHLARRAQAALLEEVARGAYQLEPSTRPTLRAQKK